MKTLEDLKKEVIQLTAAINNCINHTIGKKWTPQVYNDGYYISAAGKIYKTAHGNALNERDAGRTFKTHEAAKKANEFFRFYQLLYQLALECNAKHTEDGKHTQCYVFFSIGKNEFSWYNASGQRTGSFFTSREAAQTACEIMNRDKWIMPTM